MSDNLTNEAREGRCPRCAAAGGLRAWSELDEDEREVVRRLPASAVYSHAERAARHLWCVRCWHEETRGERREV
jgi:Zn ribbon nucleic-acid-binding protein